MVVLQHPSVESFRAELNRNPTLMMALGLPFRKSTGGVVDDDPFQTYQVPTASAFSRFNELLKEVQAQFGEVSQLFQSQVDKLREKLPDLGQDIGFDGKAIESHSTGQKSDKRINKQTNEPMTSDPDADWGCHKQFFTDENGKEKALKRLGLVTPCTF